MAVLIVVLSLLITGCTRHKPLPLYRQIEIPEVKAYQGEVNHSTNYVYRASASETFVEPNDQSVKEDKKK